MQFSATDGDTTDLGAHAANAGLGDYLGIQVNNSKIGGAWLSSFWDFTKTRQTPVGGAGTNGPDVVIQQPILKPGGALSKAPFKRASRKAGPFSFSADATKDD